MGTGLRRTLPIVGLSVAVAVAGVTWMAVRPVAHAGRQVSHPAVGATPSAAPPGPRTRIAGDPTPVSSTGTTTGSAAPVGDAPVGPDWQLEFHQDFAVDAKAGSFLSTYRDFGAYPSGWLDTSKRGHYDPNILSVSHGILTMTVHTSADGVHHVAAPYPKLPGGGSDQLYGRYSVRFRADSVDGYKVAWLLWPESGDWDDGEVDFPEGDLTRTISGFLHHAGSPSDQDSFGTGVDFSGWHVATTEWSPGRVTFLFDGRVVGTSTRYVPARPMHYVLQTETELGSDPVPSSARGDVQVDWVSIWRYR
jgi:hypothetical protein